MTFRLSITTDGAAFDDVQLTLEVSRILAEIGDHVIDGIKERSIQDRNGNTCGWYEFVSD